MKKYLAILIVEFVLFCLLYNELFNRFLPDEKSYLAIGLISFLMLIPAAILNGIYYNFKELSLLRGSSEPKLKDGERVALTGYVRALDTPLNAPFTGTPCVAYSYEVNYRTGTSKNRTTKIEYSGHVQVPSSLRTNTGEIRLLGMMDGDKESFDEEDENVLRNARGYLSSREFKGKEKFSEAWSSVKAMLTDNDGSMLEENKLTDGPLELTGRRFEEWCLEISKPYSIIGVWSASQNGLIQDPFGKGAITVLKGDVAEASKTMKGKIGCSAVLAIFLFIFFNFLAYGFLGS